MEEFYQVKFFPENEQIGFYLMSFSGGYDEDAQSSTNALGSKIMNSNPANGTSCKSVYFDRLVDEFGVDPAADNSYDYTLSVAVANTAYPASTNCVYLIQLLEFRNGGYVANPVIKLR
ncbi:MAG: hypothetical protein R2877_03345 [Bdellovibrionota bacterium]